MSVWIERTLLAIGAIGLGWFATVHIAARLDQAKELRELESVRVARASAPARSDTPLRPAPKPRDVLGKLEVPRLGLSAVVRSGVDDGTLRRAIGHVPETALPGGNGNAALAAHRDTFFRPLKNIKRGDTVRMTTPDGVREYRVSDTKIVSPDDVSVLEATSGPALTLITCYPFNYVGSAPKRFIVRATAAVAEPSVVPVVAKASVVQAAIVKAKPLKTKAKVSKAVKKKSPPKKKKKGFWGKLAGAFKADG